MMRLSERISALVHETQKERGLTAAFLGGGDDKIREMLDGQRQNVNQQREALDEFLDGWHAKGDLAQAIQDAIAPLEKLAEHRQGVSEKSVSVGEGIGYYTKFNSGALAIIGGVAHASSDPEACMQATSYLNFLQAKERAGIERAVLSNTFARGSFGPGIVFKP